jgi:endonuclease YncB( thermonuclease family)
MRPALIFLLALSLVWVAAVSFPGSPCIAAQSQTQERPKARPQAKAKAKDAVKSKAEARTGTRSQPKPTESVVARCLTGDTLQLTDRRVVHIAGIVAPTALLVAGAGKEKEKEKAKGKGAETEPFHAARSRSMLEGVAGRCRVRVTILGKDAQGNAIADVSLADGGQSVAEAMVRLGGAFCYPHAGVSADRRNRLLSLQKDAIAARRGFWGRVLSQALARETYTGDRHAGLFYPGNSSEARNIKPRNRMYFGTLMDAFLAGYGPAMPCTFWPSEKRP